MANNKLQVGDWLCLVAENPNDKPRYAEITHVGERTAYADGVGDFFPEKIYKVFLRLKPNDFWRKCGKREIAKIKLFREHERLRQIADIKGELEKLALSLQHKSWREIDELHLKFCSNF